MLVNAIVSVRANISPCFPNQVLSTADIAIDRIQMCRTGFLAYVAIQCISNMLIIVKLHDQV